MAIATGDADAAVVAYDQLHGIEFPSISGVEGGGTAINNTYQIPAYPTYILIAPDGSIVEQDIWPVSNASMFITPIESYGVQANPCAPSSAADVLTFAIPEQFEPATFGTGTIDLNLMTNTAQNALTPSFTLSSGAWADISGVEQISGVSVVDFTSGFVTYTINAEDSTTTLDWTVSVHNGLSIDPLDPDLPAVYPNPATDFVSFANATKVSFLNSLGQIVKVINSPHGVISIQEMKTGLYTVRIENGTEVENQKLVIQ
jgi:hypothetical protein